MERRFGATNQDDNSGDAMYSVRDMEQMHDQERHQGATEVLETPRGLGMRPIVETSQYTSESSTQADPARWLQMEHEQSMLKFTIHRHQPVPNTCYCNLHSVI
jgi:hypothetical protein